MAPRKKPKSRIRLLQGPDLRPGDPVWVYLRHSPGEDQSIHSQRLDVERYIAGHELVVTDWYVDEARSGGTIESRDAFERMLLSSQQQPPAVKAIVVWDLSRFSRDELEAQFYSADLRMRGYELLSLHDDIPQGEFAGVMEAFVRWKNGRYLRDLQAATLRGLDAVVGDRAVIDGVERTGFAAGGRPPVGYEARHVQTGVKPSGKPIARTYWTQTEDPDLKARVGRAWAMAITAARTGLPISMTEVHRECSLFRDVTSYYSLYRTITYCGIRRVGKRMVEGAHEAYVTREEFDLVQIALPKGNARPVRIHPRRVHSPFILSGRVFCGYCGGAVNYDRDNRRVSYSALRCATRKNDSTSCILRKLKYDTFIDALIEALQEQLLTEETLSAVLEETNRLLSARRANFVEEKGKLERRLASLDRSVEKLLDALEAGNAPEPIRRRLAQREQERTLVRAQLAELLKIRDMKPRQVRGEDLLALVREMNAILEDGDPAEVKRLLEKIVVRVEIKNDSGRIYYVPPLRGYEWYPVGDSNARTWLRRPALYPLS